MLLFLLSFFLAASAVRSVSSPSPAERRDSLRVMFYNVENLFDTIHDEGKRDWDFLPHSHPGKQAGCELIRSEHYRKRCLETDWNEQKLAIKLAQIRKVVLHGRRPDILGLCEVENARVLKSLAAQLGYSHYLITDGSDPRGINVALLYNGNNRRFTYRQHRTYRLRTGQHLPTPTRDLLEVEFRLASRHERLIVYVMHWPSQRSPSQARMVAARRAIELIRDQQRRAQRVNIVVIGDFNVIAADHPHPFRELFDGLLNDAQHAFMNDRNIAWKKRLAAPTGTYFFPPQMRWNNLDRIFYNKNLRDNKGLELDVGSFRVLAHPWLTKTFTYKKPGEFLLGSTINNVPRRYNFQATEAEEAGYSDHFALQVDLHYR